MLKFFYKLFNYDKIDELNRTIEIYKERNSQLEKENKECKGYKLKYEVTKMYVEDDDALIEIFETAEECEKYKSEMQSGHAALRREFNRQQAALGGGAHGLSCMSGLLGQGLR